MNKMSIAVAALFLTAGTAWAQETAPRPQMQDCPKMGGMMGMQGMGGGMMMGHGQMPRVNVFQPAHLLARKDVLELSADQVGRLEALQASAEKTSKDAQAAARARHEELAEAVAAPGADPKSVRSLFDAAHAAMAKAHWTKMETALRAKAVLSEAQRARVQGWADAMGMQMRGRMGEGMKGPGMGMGPGMMGPGECPRQPTPETPGQ